MNMTQTHEVSLNISERIQHLIQQDQIAGGPSYLLPLKSILHNFAILALSEKLNREKEIVSTILDYIAELDERISNQIDEILHHEQFQRLEASWRGVLYLIQQTPPSKKIKFRVLPVTKQELLVDFQKAVEFDQNNLFRLVYESEFGSFGGTPYGILMGDYEFSQSSQDLFLLEQISHVASAAHAPFLSSASPHLLGVERFGELEQPKNFAKLFASGEFASWMSLRKKEDSRYVSLLLPHILLRLPYGRDPKRRIHPGPICYEEDLKDKTPKKYLWGNAIYALGSCLCDSFIRTGWFASFYGLDNGGKVENLPLPFFDTVLAPKMSVDLCIPDTMERELSDEGLISLVHCRWTDYCAFFGRNTIYAPAKHKSALEKSNARLSSLLSYLLIASRFAHYIKIMLREKIGKFATPREIEDFLNDWIHNYVAATPKKAATNIKYPLSAARVDVSEKNGEGALQATLYLKPHFHLESLIEDFKFVTNLPEA